MHARIKKTKASPDHTPARRLIARIREAGDRITGGGVRSLGKRLLLNLVRRFIALARHRPRLRALARPLLRLSLRVARRPNQIRSFAHPSARRIYIPPGRLSRYRDELALTLPASARLIYLRLQAEAQEAGSWNRH
jgi:hypothetical protein